MKKLILKNLLKKEIVKEGEFMKINDFIIGETLGQGAFGKVTDVDEVREVIHSASKTKYALKYMSKETCIQSRSLKNVFRERVILQQLHHRYIANLRYSFKDEDNLYFVIDYLDGGDLERLLKERGTLPPMVVKYMVAQMALALDHIHANEIVHRDLKPANILCDTKGNFYVTDFNCSISLKERIPNSSAGTLDYMAPEMFLKKEYTYSVDWWSLGVKPFSQRSSKETISAIRKQDVAEIIYELTHTLEQAHIDFIVGLLERDIQHRIGCSRELDVVAVDFVKDKFYEGFDWKSLTNGTFNTGFAPTVTKKTKQSNFDVKQGSVLSMEVSKKKLAANSSNRSNGWLKSKISSWRSDILASDEFESEQAPSLETREALEEWLIQQHFHDFDFEKPEYSQLVVLPSYFNHEKKVPRDSKYSVKKPINELQAKNIQLDPKLNTGKGSNELTVEKVLERKSSSFNLKQGGDKTLSKLSSAEGTKNWTTKLGIEIN